MLQPCPVPEEDDAAPATPLIRICCCCAIELDSLSSCCTMRRGGGRVVEPVKRKIELEWKEEGHYRNNTNSRKKKLDTKHIRSQGYGVQKRHWPRSRLWLRVFIAHTSK